MSKKLFSFDEFLTNESVNFSKQADHFEEEVKAVLHVKIWEGIEKSVYFSEHEKKSLSMILTEANLDCSLLNESILGTMRAAVGKLIAKGADIKEEVIDKLKNIMKSATDFARYLKDLLLKAWDKLIGYFKKKYEPVIDHVKKEIARRGQKSKFIGKNFVEELEQLKETASFWLKEFPKLMTDAISGTYSKEILKECLEQNADIILTLSQFDPNKQGPFSISEADDNDEPGVWSFLNDITHKLEKVPPFSWLSKAAEIAEAGVSKFLGKLSELTHKAGGPGPYDFAALAVIAGFFFEYRAKHLGKETIEDIFTSEGLLRFLPMARSIVLTLSYVALTLAILDLAKELSKEGEIEGEETKKVPA